MPDKKIQVSDNILNLAQLQDKMDDIVFNHLDTTQNWKRAYEGLDELLLQAISYFKVQVEEANGTLPKGTVYWNLFMDIVSKIIYFRTSAEKHLVDFNNPSEKEKVLYTLKVAANCLPNVQKGNKEFLQEIAQFYEEIELFEGKEGAFEQFYLSKNNSIEDCLKNFEQRVVEREKQELAHS